MPEFLRGTHREEKPERNQYMDVSSEEEGDNVSSVEEGLEDSHNKGKTELYWIHLIEYKQTQLRKVFTRRTRALRSEWEFEVQEGQLRVDFLEAVTKCGGGFYLKRIE